MRRTLLTITLLTLFALPLAGTGAHAMTVPGTVIRNMATLSYSVGNVAFPAMQSNETAFTVLELIDFTVTWQDAAPVRVTMGDKNAVTTFVLQNAGNGNEAFRLALSAPLPADGEFAPLPVALYLDNGDGLFDAATDILYIAGTNDPLLASLATVTIFALSDIPTAGLTDEQLGRVRLTATATSAGAPGTPGATLAGVGDGGVDAVLGRSGGQAEENGVYQAELYDLTLNRDGAGSVVSGPDGIACGDSCGAAFAINAEVLLTATPEPGWRFVAWSGACAGNDVTCTVTMDAAKAVTAQFALLTYPVNYLGNGETAGSSPAEELKTHGLDMTLAGAGDLVRDGYTFAGWNTAADGSGDEYAANSPYAEDAPLTLYAQWIAVASTYPVTYDGNDATAGAAPAAQNKEQGIDLTLADQGDLLRDGFTFAGWNTAADGSGTQYDAAGSYTTDAPLALYAQWQPAALYTVTYNGNGATSGTLAANQNKTHDVDLALAAQGDLSREGYTFAGWNTANDGSGTTYAESEIYTENAPLALYAQWTPDSYPVRYDGNDATGGATPADQSKTHGLDLTLAGQVELLRDGYTFAGWNTAADGGGTFFSAGASYTGNAPLTLYAVWTTQPTYSIAYDGNGAEDGATPANQLKIHDIDLALQGNSGLLSRSGFLFTGWNTAADGSGDSYAPGAAYTQNADLVLYAVWAAAAPFTVQYHANGAESGSAPVNQSKTSGIDLTLHGNSGLLARTGYVFAGWDTAADGSGTDYPSGALYTDDADLLLYARWTPAVTYSVQYRGNGATTGTAPANQSKIHDVVLTLHGNSGDLARDGYLFAGWNTAADGSGTQYDATADYTANAPLTIYARWVAVGMTYPVSYDANGATAGPAPESQTKIAGIDLTLANRGDLARDGHTFVGWNTAADGTGTAHGEGAIYSGNAPLALFAQWTPNTYPVTYTANGATAGSAPAAANKVHGVDLTLATAVDLLRDGYTFSGWNTAADGSGVVYAEGATYGDNAPLALFAQWTPITYPVSYDGNGATAGTAPAAQNKTHGVDLTLATKGDLLRAGFVFAGWNTQADGSGVDYDEGGDYPENAALLLYAHWVTADTTYTVSYDGNGATSGSVPPAQSKTVAVDLTLASNSGNLARDGYTFAGWNTQADGNGIAYATEATYASNADVLLFAQWLPDTYPVNYHGNGASSGTPPAEQSKTHDVDLTLAAAGDLVREGHTFTGWNTQADGSGTDYAANANYSGNAPLTLFAQWTLNSYPVVYHGNGADGGTVPPAQSKDHGSELSLAEAGDLSRVGHTFAGWNTQADGAGTFYAAGAPYSSDEPLTLHAIWTLNIYTIVYDGNGADSGTAPESQSKAHGEDLPVRENSGALDAAGMVFAGWNTAADGSGAAYAPGAIFAENRSLTLYAVWVPIVGDPLLISEIIPYQSAAFPYPVGSGISDANLRLIPGSFFHGVVRATNARNQPLDTVVVTIPVPDWSKYCIDNAQPGLTRFLTVSDGAVASALSLRAVRFSRDGGEAFDYLPVRDSQSCDAVVTHLQVEFAGAFAAKTDAGEPSFELRLIGSVK